MLIIIIFKEKKNPSLFWYWILPSLNCRYVVAEYTILSANIYCFTKKINLIIFLKLFNNIPCTMLYYKRSVKYVIIVHTLGLSLYKKKCF